MALHILCFFCCALVSVSGVRVTSRPTHSQGPDVNSTADTLWPSAQVWSREHGESCKVRPPFKAGTCTGGSYCYETCLGQVTVPGCTGRKAYGFSQGRCRIARTKPCDFSVPCRPGTACVPAADGGHGRTCESCNAGLAQPAWCIELAVAEAIARLSYINEYTQTLASKMKAMPEMKLEEALSEYRQDTLNVANTQEIFRRLRIEPVTAVDKLELGEARRSLKHIVVMGKNGASRSGATFFKSRDGKYLVKGFARKDEYESLVEIQKDIRSVSVERGWATETGRRPTTLNIATFGFPAFGKEKEPAYWSVMPDAGVAFHEQLVSVRSVKTFDTKPLPLISEKRDEFLQYLREIDFRPDPKDERSLTFFDTLRQDLAYLQNRDLVDYSWLVYVYDAEDSPSLPLDVPCFRTSTGRYVCFSLIDYTLTFEGCLMHLESKVLGDKWERYEAKFNTYTDCLWKLATPVYRLSGMFGLDSLFYNVSEGHQGQPVMDLRMRARRRSRLLLDSWLESGSLCGDYRDAACGGLMLTSTIKRYKQKLGISSIYLPLDLTCRFEIAPSPSWQTQAEFCLAYLAVKCYQLTRWENASHNIQNSHYAMMVMS
eukprot:TRINITY_DN31531_c0_g1_i1.p1 TRINITY_DN31531_c0_g1~~TRINITY_DN31531_c0_g1_i1.p1  ORF type:complete len:612 (+),score=26.11 TRINITY_DN31531_c0_g1_i1:38-1837(+)